MAGNLKDKQLLAELVEREREGERERERELALRESLSLLPLWQVRTILSCLNVGILQFISQRGRMENISELDQILKNTGMDYNRRLVASQL